jgi:hypothetical protein
MTRTPSRTRVELWRMRRVMLLTRRPAVDEIEVSSPTGVVIAIVTLREDEKR